MIPTADIELTAEQNRAVDFALSEMKRPYGIAAISGPAGSGKTTILKRIGELLAEREPVTFSAMTGKAALVLQTKGIDAVTLHQACMKPVFKPPFDKLGKYFDEVCGALKLGSTVPMASQALLDEYSFEDLLSASKMVAKFGTLAGFRALGIKDIFKYLDRWDSKPPADGILIVDEASMMSEDNMQTIRKVFRRILLVGDEYQLPPVSKDGEKGIFWEISTRFNLTEIHRQAEGSQPLRIATAIRTNQPVVPEPIEWVDVEKCRTGTPIIVWTNKTRIALTHAIRKKLNLPSTPAVGEYLVCRSGGDRAAQQRGLINNTIWKIVEADGFKLSLENDEGIILENEYVHIEELENGYGTNFRFAYALTAHNAQGSEWPEVMVHVNDGMSYCNFKPDEGKKWLYTAVTRAKERVIWVNE